MSDSSLLQAINRLWILNPATLLDLKKKAEKADEQQTKKLLELVKTVEQKQTDFVEKMVQADPEFPKKLDAFLRESLRATQGEVEASDKVNLSSIDTQIGAS